MANARNLIANMTPKGRLMLGGSAAALLLLVFFMVRIAGQASYSTLMAGIDPKQTSKITAALDAKGIKYEIQNNGTALAVDKSQIGQARIALAEKGLPGKGQPGFELFDKQKLGADARRSMKKANRTTPTAEAARTRRPLGVVFARMERRDPIG